MKNTVQNTPELERNYLVLLAEILAEPLTKTHFSSIAPLNGMSDSPSQHDDKILYTFVTRLGASRGAWLLL